MSPAQRRTVFVVAMAALAALYGAALGGLPGFGHYPGPYGDLLNAVAVAQRHATDVVTAINFDYRGFDTLGEEFILFTAARGVAVVLRVLRDEHEDPGADAPIHRAAARGARTGTSATRAASLVLLGLGSVVGWNIVSHGQVSPGGGFQGGVILASAVLLVHLGGQYVAFRRVSPSDVLDAGEAVGAGGFAAIGLAALLVGSAFLTNVLPLGSQPGTVDSSGTIALISFAVGVEVTASLLLIVSELLEQTFLVRAAR